MWKDATEWVKIMYYTPNFCFFYPIATAGVSLITGIKAITENATANQTLNNINEAGKMPRMWAEWNRQGEGGMGHTTITTRGSGVKQGS